MAFGCDLVLIICLSMTRGVAALSCGSGCGRRVLYFDWRAVLLRRRPLTRGVAAFSCDVGFFVAFS
jgi:hypothetical protein